MNDNINYEEFILNHKIRNNENMYRSPEKVFDIDNYNPRDFINYMDLVIFKNGVMVLPYPSHMQFLAKFFMEDQRTIPMGEYGPEYYTKNYGVISIHNPTTMIFPNEITSPQMHALTMLMSKRLIKPSTIQQMEMGQRHQFFIEHMNGARVDFDASDIMKIFNKK